MDEKTEKIDSTDTENLQNETVGNATNGQETNTHFLRGLEFLSDIPLQISVELGRTKMSLGDVLALGPSSIVELTKASGEPLDVRVNGLLIAQGEAVVVNDRFGIRLTSVVERNRLIRSINPDE